MKLCIFSLKIPHPSYFPSKMAHWEGLGHEIGLVCYLYKYKYKCWHKYRFCQNLTSILFSITNRALRGVGSWDFLDLLLRLSDFFLKFWNLSWSFIFFFHIHLIFHQKSRIERGWTNHDSGEKWNFVFLFFFFKISHPSYFPSKIGHWEGSEHEIGLESELEKGLGPWLWTLIWKCSQQIQRQIFK